MTRHRTVPAAQVKAEEALDDVRSLARKLRRTGKPNLVRAADAMLLQSAESMAAIVREVEARFSPSQFSARTGT